MFFSKRKETEPVLPDTKKVVELSNLAPGDEIIYRPVRAGLFRHHLTPEKIYTIRPSFWFLSIRDDNNDLISILFDERKHFQMVIDKGKPEKKISKRSRKKYGHTKKSKRN